MRGPPLRFRARGKSATMSEPTQQELEYSRFAINDRPYCVWDYDLRAKNLGFLRQVQPDFFTYQADVHSAQLETESHRQFAAVALRGCYSHALETFFALLCAAVQAPDCPVGYVTLYRDTDLVSVVRRISARRRVLAKIDIADGWDTVSRQINMFSSELQGRANVTHSFARLWARLAIEYVDAGCRAEYNTMKHGFRAALGGFSTGVAKEHQYGVAPPSNEMRMLSGSEFGTTTFTLSPIPEAKHHFSVGETSRNWFPQNLAAGIRLLTMSMVNVIAWLRFQSGDEGDLRGRVPERDEMFDAPWSRRATVERFGTTSGLSRDDIDSLATSDILAVYGARIQ
jgi:hypothetical protein